MSIAQHMERAWRWICAQIAGELHVQHDEGMDLPRLLPKRTLVHLTIKGRDWMAGMRCPCGCGDTIELMLLAGTTPRWDLCIDRRGRPTLYPSVHRTAGCRSHFWVRAGRITWCR